MNLFPFQVAAATEIAEKYATYAKEPLAVTRTRLVPFYQNLSALTGSGKTLILADAVSQIRSHLSAEPIVLWLSKGKVVVWQTYTNLSAGKYTELVSGFMVKPLMECSYLDIEDDSRGLLLVATVGKFNQRDKSEGDRRIYQLALDQADSSLWDRLKARRTSTGRRRPFIVIYDEGHNLSSQQTELLLELEPDALIAASATMRIPEALEGTISRLKKDKKWVDTDFATVVRSGEVVQSGLVKQHILLGGYVTPMEVAIDDMIDNLRQVEDAASNLDLPFRPKAIYVSATNVVPGKGNMDDIHIPFEERQARPILIWRHLVENHHIDPASIAVYCNLRFDSKFPPPLSFNLFSGGDSDYDRFIAGNFQHIIFNLTLQEGWDDAACYFAYVDKDMGSRDQVTQIVGRVLRQPLAQHYPDPSLNTAHFFIRTDEKNVFEEVLQDVKHKIASEAPEINLTVVTARDRHAAKPLLEPKKTRYVPEVTPDFTYAVEPIREIFASIQDFRRDSINTQGKGGRLQVLQTIGQGNTVQNEWVEVEHSNRVNARWMFTREVQKAYPKAIHLCDIEHPKLDALIEYNSPAADHIREAARKVVKAYVDHSRVVQSSFSPKEIPAVHVDPADVTDFTFAIHAGYSGLNSLELEFARALDRTQRVWFRNPSQSFFEIPILRLDGTKNFNPDFIVWVERDVVVIDTKGDHLIRDDAARKLFYIDKIGTGPDLRIRLVTRGIWNERFERESANDLGFTVWVLRNGKPHPIPAKKGVSEAVQICLRNDS